MRDVDQIIAEAMAHMTWRQRLRFRTETFMRHSWWTIRAHIPGYQTASRALYRMRLQGVSGLFEPVFNITTQDFGKPDRRLRWHGWGVLAHGDGFRAYTPTRVADFATLSSAWLALEDVYWGRSAKAGAVWQPIGRDHRALELAVGR